MSKTQFIFKGKINIDFTFHDTANFVNNVHSKFTQLYQGLLKSLASAKVVGNLFDIPPNGGS